MCKPVNLTCPLCHSKSFTLAEVNTSYWVYTIEDGKLVDREGVERRPTGVDMIMGECDCGYTWVVGEGVTVIEMFPEYQKPVIRKLSTAPNL